MAWNLGIIGDSYLDEYQAEDDRGGAYHAISFSPIEVIARARSAYFNVGAWGTRAAPRRTGYEYCWARSGATAGDLFTQSPGTSIVSQGQHTGLAAQVTAGAVDTVVIWIGINDFHILHDTYRDVYDGTVEGANLTAKINSIVSNLTTTLDTLIAAGATRILVSDFQDFGPGATALYPIAAFRQRVTNAINLVNSSLYALIAARPTVALMPAHDWFFTTLPAEYPIVGGSITVGGEQIDTTVNADEPHHFALADSHIGTVGNGIVVNQLFRDPLLAEFGLSMPRLTDIEILAQAGLAETAPIGTPVLSVR